MSSPTTEKPNGVQIVQVAAAVPCNERTARRYFSGEHLGAMSIARIEKALRELGLERFRRPAPAKQQSAPPPEAA